MRLLPSVMLFSLVACGGPVSADETPGLAGTSTGTGANRSYAVAEFVKVAQAGPDDVDVRVGSGFSVRAEGDESAISQVRIGRDGETLRIGRRSGVGWSSTGKVKVYVTMPRITAISLAGAGDVTIDRVEGASFNGEIAGAGDLTIGTVAVDALTLSAVGAGDITARGTAGSLKASTTGAGDIDAAGLTVQQAEVDATGAGNVRATVDGEAKVSLMGAGDVTLGPKARCTVTKMGPGTVRCGG